MQQGKGILKFFLILIVLVTAWQYFQIIPTMKVEKNADSYAQEQVDLAGDSEDLKTVRSQARSYYLDSMSSENVLSIPLIKDYTYDELKKGQLGLGLDLKGGMSVTMMVDLQDFLRRLAQGSEDPAFEQALTTAQENLKNAQDDYITLFGEAYDDIDGAKPLAAIFGRNKSLTEDINVNSTNGDVVRVLRSRADNTVQLVFDRLKERIDRLGTTQPSVSLDASRDLILVELPGIENPEAAKSYLTASANLEFWKTYRATDQNIMNTIFDINTRLQEEEKLTEEDDTPTEYNYIRDTVTNEIIDSVPMELQDQDPGPLFRIFSPSLTSENTVPPSPIIGYADKKNRDKVLELLKREDIINSLPPGIDFYWDRSPITDAEGKRTRTYPLYAVKKDRGPDPHMDGEVVTKASAVPDPSRGVSVSLSMNSQGAQTWADLTTEAYNGGEEREIAIVLDDEVISAPSVQGPIPNGNTSITGGFTLQEANDLANMLEVGKLPANTKIIQSNVVGPSLGADNIKKSVNSLAIGLLLVLLFMVFYYGTGGVVSIIALVLNMIFLLAALAGAGTVLTLPGVAGIVLTIGMAVDANVIIYERIREELRLGKTMLASVRDGFKNSYSAIIDANVTSLLTAIVLMVFGLGPIKGFAVVLIAGILSSFFTAVLLGRLMIEWWITGDRKMSFSTPPTKNAFANLNIDWLSKRKVAYVISSVVIIAGIISMFARGFELGVDFKGGYSYNIEFPQEQEVDLVTLRSGIESAMEGASTTVKAVSTQNTYNVVTSYLIESDADDATEQVLAKLHEGVNSATGGSLDYDDFADTESEGIHVTSSAKVGPTIADDIKKSSRWATIFSLLLIFLYILLRFTKWQYSLGAVAALLHDTLFVLGIFSMLHFIVPFSLEVDQAFIGALLTVIGYSINDTVVVFDRIREYLGIYNNKSKKEVINMAINSTISRTVITSLTTLFVVLVLFLFGGDSIKGMAFALVVGVVVGTYSSVFVATPIMADFTKDLTAKGAKKKSSFNKHVTS